MTRVAVQTLLEQTAEIVDIAETALIRDLLDGH